MAETKNLTKTIERIKRLSNSEMGNPRFLFVFTDGTQIKTATNASVGYEVVQGWEGKTFDITLNGRGTIIAAKEVNQ